MHPHSERSYTRRALVRSWSRPAKKYPHQKSLQIFCGDPGLAHRTGTECRTEGPAIVTCAARQSRRAGRAVRRQCAISSRSGRIASGIICGTAEAPQRCRSCPSADGVPRNGGFPFKGERSGSPPKVFSVGLMRGKPAGRGIIFFLVWVTESPNGDPAKCTFCAPGRRGYNTSVSGDVKPVWPEFHLTRS